MNFKKILVGLLFVFFFNYNYAQEFEDVVCGLDGDTNPMILKTSNSEIETKNEYLLEYLNNVKEVFGQSFARYNIRIINGRYMAAAHFQRIGSDMAARVITIDENYYSSLVTDSENKKALFIWIISHEIQHHINGDLHYDNKIIAANMKKEILADERAGFAVGKLTNVNIDFFEKVLPKVVRENRYSNTHPERVFRIMASKAGWIRSKLNQSNDENIFGVNYIRKEYNNGEAWGQYSNDAFNGTLIYLFNSGGVLITNETNSKSNGKGIEIKMDDQNEVSSVFFGNLTDNKRNGFGSVFNTDGSSFKGMFKDNTYSGQGTFIYPRGSKYVGNFVDDVMSGQGVFYGSNGNRYEGHFENNKFNGYGIYYYKDGSVYRGNFKDDFRHGDGIFYKDEELISAGCWEEGEYKGVTCKKD